MPVRQLPESRIPLRQRVENLVVQVAYGCTADEFNADLEVLLSTRFMADD